MWQYELGHLSSVDLSLISGSEFRLCHSHRAHWFCFYRKVQSSVLDNDKWSCISVVLVVVPDGPAKAVQQVLIISNLFVAGVHFITGRKVRSCCRVFQLRNYQFLHKIPGYEAWEVWGVRCEGNIGTLEIFCLIFDLSISKMRNEQTHWKLLIEVDRLRARCRLLCSVNNKNISRKFSRKYFNPDKAVILLLTGGRGPLLNTERSWSYQNILSESFCYGSNPRHEQDRHL